MPVDSSDTVAQQAKERLQKRLLQDTSYRKSLFDAARTYFSQNDESVKFDRKEHNTPFSFIRCSDGRLFCLYGHNCTDLVKDSSESKTLKVACDKDGRVHFMKRLDPANHELDRSQQFKIMQLYFGNQFAYTNSVTTRHYIFTPYGGMNLVNYISGLPKAPSRSRRRDYLNFQVARTQALLSMAIRLATQIQVLHTPRPELDGDVIVHCDLKLGNVTIDRNLQVRLIDFGTASIIKPDKNAYIGWNELLGTRYFSPPYILDTACLYEGKKQYRYTKASDLYSFAKMLEDIFRHFDLDYLSGINPLVDRLKEKPAAYFTEAEKQKGGNTSFLRAQQRQMSIDNVIKHLQRLQRINRQLSLFLHRATAAETLLLKHGEQPRAGKRAPNFDWFYEGLEDDLSDVVDQTMRRNRTTDKRSDSECVQEKLFEKAYIRYSKKIESDHATRGVGWAFLFILALPLLPITMPIWGVLFRRHHLRHQAKWNEFQKLKQKSSTRDRVCELQRDRHQVTHRRATSGLGVFAGKHSGMRALSDMACAMQGAAA